MALSFKMKDTPMFLKFIPLAIALIAAPALPAVAAESDPAATIVRGDVVQRTTHVRFDDLDLSKPADAKRLRSRIHAAADRVCGARRATDLSNRMDGIKCSRAAVAAAQPQVARVLGSRGGDAVAVLTVTGTRP